MIEIRIHGRGGQGAVTAARLLAYIFFKDDNHVQAFPFFGVERRGAPVEAYCRYSKEKIYLREHVYNPDIVIVLDPSLDENIIKKGTTQNTKFYYNRNSDDEYSFDATSLAYEVFGAPIVNTAMVAFFAKKEGIPKEYVEYGIKKLFSGEALKKNLIILEKVYGE